MNLLANIGGHTIKEMMKLLMNRLFTNRPCLTWAWMAGVFRSWHFGIILYAKWSLVWCFSVECVMHVFCKICRMWDSRYCCLHCFDTVGCVAGRASGLWRGENLYMAQLMSLPLTVSFSSNIHIGFTFLIPTPCSPGQRAIKWVLLSSSFATLVKRGFYLHFSAFNSLRLLIGCHEEHPACKKFEWWGSCMVIYLEQSANGFHMVQLSCFVKIQNGSAFLLPTYTGCPGKSPLKGGSCYCSLITIILVFTRDSLYAIARICHGNSVCPSVCHTGGSVKNGWS